MGFLSFSSVAEMQKTIKRNRELLKKRKSMKEISKNFHEKSSGEKLTYNKMSQAEFEQFKLKVEKARKEEQKKRFIVIGVLALLGAIVLFIMI